MDQRTIGDNRPPAEDRLALAYAAELELAEKIAEAANALPRECASDEALIDFGLVARHARDLWIKLDKRKKAETEPLREEVKRINGWFGEIVDRMDRIVKAVEARATDYQKRKAAEERRRQEEEERRRWEEAEAARAAAATARKKGDEDQAILLRAAEDEARRKAEEAAATSRHVETAKVQSAALTAGVTKLWTFEVEDYAALDLNELRAHFSASDIDKAIRSFVRINRGYSSLKGVRIFEDSRARFR